MRVVLSSYSDRKEIAEIIRTRDVRITGLQNELMQLGKLFSMLTSELGYSIVHEHTVPLDIVKKDLQLFPEHSCIYCDKPGKPYYDKKIKK